MLKKNISIGLTLGLLMLSSNVSASIYTATWAWDRGTYVRGITWTTNSSSWDYIYAKDMSGRAYYNNYNYSGSSSWARTLIERGESKAVVWIVTAPRWEGWHYVESQGRLRFRVTGSTYYLTRTSKLVSI
jgi:hypothetical protein